MSAFISPSVLVCQGAGLQSEGAHVCDARHVNERCAVCGRPFEQGDVIDELVLPPTFTNHSSLANPSGAWRCGACTAVMMRREFQTSASTVLITREGLFPISRKEHRTWLFLTPPDPPFAIAIQNAKNQHTVWRAPITLSRDQMLLRVGEQVLRVRRPHLLAAANEARMLNALRVTVGRPSKETVQTPFVNDWKMQSSKGGMLKAWVWKILHEERIARDAISHLLTLNGAEAWALTAVLHDAPVAPDPIVLQ